jgi:exodeoxyribonuclease III
MDAKRAIIPRMRLFSWNVNGIRAGVKKGLFQSFVKAERPDVLCLQETKAERGQIEIDLPDYHEYWNSAVKKGYSGTAIFSKEKPIAVVNGFPHEFAARFRFADELERDSSEEGRVISAEFPKFYVVTVYTPNAKDDLSRLALRHKQWDPAFLAYCKQLEKAKPVVFCGDLNVAHTELDLAHPKSNRGKKGFTDEEREGFQHLIDAGFIDTFRLFTQGNGYYTWWSPFANSRARNVGWRIDYVLVSASLRAAVKAADIYPEVMGSDHCPVSVTLDA